MFVKVAMACNWVRVPRAMVLAAGITCRVLRVVLVIWMLVLPVTPSTLAESVVDPAAMPLTRPLPSTVATAVLLLSQAT
ncbi:hypothetical protein D3C79_890070 [compost metagenome]